MNFTGVEELATLGLYEGMIRSLTTGLLGIVGVLGVLEGLGFVGVDGLLTAELALNDGFGLRTPAATSLVKVPLISEVNCQNMIPAFQPL